MNERIFLRVSADEKMELETYAKQLNLTLSQLIRQAAPSYAQQLLKQKDQTELPVV